MLITHGRLVTMTEPNEVIEDGALYIHDGLIADLGRSQEILARHQPDHADGAGDDVIDAGGKLILPANICAHTHFYGAFARGMSVPGDPPSTFTEILERLWWKLDRALDMEGIWYSTLVCLIDAIRHGTTTLIDHHASPNAIDGSLDVIASAVEQSGLRAALCYEVSDRNGMEGARAGIRENIRFALACQERHSLAVKPAFGLHALFTISDETLDRCVADAAAAGIPVHLHVAEDQVDQLKSLANYKLRVVERLAVHGGLGGNTLCAHCVHVNENEIAVLAEAGSKVSHQPRSNMNNAVGTAPVKAMLGAGLCVGLGNDGFSNNAFTEMKFANLLHRHTAHDPQAMEAPTVLHIAYACNAQIARLFWSSPCGTLQVGAQADVILADYRPFTPFTSTNAAWHIMFGMDGSEVTHTLCAGQVVMKNRQILTLDEVEIASRAVEVAERTWERVVEM